jgi:hypothetical protein
MRLVFDTYLNRLIERVESNSTLRLLKNWSDDLLANAAWWRKEVVSRAIDALPHWVMQRPGVQAIARADGRGRSVVNNSSPPQKRDAYERFGSPPNKYASSFV